MLDPREGRHKRHYLGEIILMALAAQLIAIDGMAARHSIDTGTDAGHLHLLSAWACEEGISLAHAD